MSPRRREGPGLASALAGGLLLAVIGFSLGIVGGLVLEEPDLLLDYVSGRARRVDVAAAPTNGASLAAAPPVPAAPTSDVAAPPPLEDAEGTPPEPVPSADPPAALDEAPSRAEDLEPERAGRGDGVEAERAEVETAPAPPPTEAAPETPPTEVARTEPLPAAPAGRGFSVQVGAFGEAAAAEQLARRLEGQGLPVYVAPSAGAGAKWRVRVGPLPTRGEADRIAERLAARDRLPTWVLADGP